MERKLTPEEYWMSGGGIVCPVCRNYLFSSPDQVTLFEEATRETRIERMLWCKECGSKWTEYYTMIRAHITHLGVAD